MHPGYPSSFLDRLTPNGRGSTSSPARNRQGDFLEALARDVEDLLNSLAPARSAPEWAESCNDSILNYGLPDRAFFCSDPLEAARLLAETITRFEPRLHQVRVDSIRPEPDHPGHFRLEVCATLVDWPRSEVLLTSTFRGDRSSVGITLFVTSSDER